MVKKQEKEEVKEQDTDLTDTLKRVQADFENYRKQTEKRLEEMRKFASKQLLLDLLPILDHFQLALQHTQDPKEFKKGVEMIYAQLMETLGAVGLKTIEAQGQFDVERHEALIKVESDKPKNTIIEQIQPGYQLHDVVLRPAKVKVSAGEKQEKEEDQ